MTKVVIAGLGNMGQAIYDILSKDESYELSGFGREENPNEYLIDSDVLIVAVKPQSFATFAKSISVDLSNCIVVSVMAGQSIANIEDQLRCIKVVRVMPNIPLKVGHAFCAWKENQQISAKEDFLIRELLGKLGSEMKVEKEEQIDFVTALSGSGPAYFCRLVEAMEDSAEKMGFSREDAKFIIKETFIGTAKLMEKGNLDSTELKVNVTSRGGTTEAAMDELSRRDFDGIVDQAVEAALRRAKELNENDE
jgi:pyrroline-5-carboxylate reductase